MAFYFIHLQSSEQGIPALAHVQFAQSPLQQHLKVNQNGIFF